MAIQRRAAVLHLLHRVAASHAAAEQSDAQFVERFVAARDEAAFAALVRRHGPMVLGVCRRVVKDWHTAEDAFQATFLVLARKARDLRQPGRLAAWLHGVAHRVALKARGQTCRRRAVESRAADMARHAQADQHDNGDLAAVIDAEVMRLPERQRAAVVLCYLEARTNAEAARALGCSRGSIATLLARARQRLRRRLVRRGVGLGATCLGWSLIDAARAAELAGPLAAATARAALLTPPGGLAASGLFVPGALAERTLRGMAMHKLKIALVVVLGFLGAGAGLSALAGRAEGPPPAPPDVPVPLAPLVPVAEPVQTTTLPIPGSEQAARTENFVITAPTDEIAARIAREAERQRKDLAIVWLGTELPRWPQPCPIHVVVNSGKPACATTFAFESGRMLRREMRLEGKLDAILTELLPHEMTHVVLADWAQRPLPRWADEGAALLAESGASRAQYRSKARKLVEKGGTLPLAQLLPMQEYPKNLTAFYVQSGSLTNFLVQAEGRATFLAFVRLGMSGDWDRAVKLHYGYRDVKGLEQAWLAAVRKAAESPSATSVLPSPGETPTPTQPLPPAKLPTGLAPVQAMAKFRADGRLVVWRQITYYEPVTTIARGTPTTSYRQVTEPTSFTYAVDGVVARDVAGKRLDAKKLRTLLEKSETVLVSADGGPIDPLHLRLYKDGTVVLELPALPATTAPPTVPAAPVVPTIPAQAEPPGGR